MHHVRNALHSLCNILSIDAEIFAQRIVDRSESRHVHRMLAQPIQPYISILHPRKLNTKKCSTMEPRAKSANALAQHKYRRNVQEKDTRTARARRP